MSGARLRFRSIDAATAAYIAALSVRPTDAEIIAINRLVRAFKDCGAWSNLDAIYPLLGSVENDSKVNLKTPGTYNLTKVNSPVFTANAGWRSNNAGYLDSGFNVSTSGGLLTQNNACLGVCVAQDLLSAGGLMGFANSGLIIPRNASNNFLSRLCNVSSANTAASGAGLHAVTRGSSAAIRQWRRGDFVLQTSIASTTLPSSTVTLLTGNNGASTSLDTLNVTFAFFGANLTGRQILAINNAYAAYAAFYGVSSS